MIDRAELAILIAGVQMMIDLDQLLAEPIIVDQGQAPAGLADALPALQREYATAPEIRDCCGRSHTQQPLADQQIPQLCWVALSRLQRLANGLHRRNHT